MKADDIAHYVAANLPAAANLPHDVGEPLQYAVIRALNNPTPAAQPTRSIAGEALSRTAEIAVIAHFIVSVAPAVLDRIRTRRESPADVKEELTAARPPDLKKEIAEQVVDLSVQKASTNPDPHA